MLWIQIHGWATTVNSWFVPKAENSAWQTLKIQAPATYCLDVVIQYVVSACIFNFCPAMFFELLTQK
jgi:hypothetical protein